MKCCKMRRSVPCRVQGANVGCSLKPQRTEERGTRPYYLAYSIWNRRSQLDARDSSAHRGLAASNSVNFMFERKVEESNPNRLLATYGFEDRFHHRMSPSVFGQPGVGIEPIAHGMRPRVPNHSGLALLAQIVRPGPELNRRCSISGGVPYRLATGPH